MSNRKRAPTLALGLFSYLFLFAALPPGAGEGFSLSAEAGSLWVEDEGAALYWQSGLSAQKGEQFYSDIALGQIISSLPWTEGAVLGGLGKFSFSAPRLGLDFSYGFFQHDLFSSKTEDFSVYNDGGQGFFASVKTPVHSGDWSIAPSFLYGSGAWTEGSLYWFFGKPKIPALVGYGLSFSYYKQHELAFQYLSMDLDILSNEAERLFDSHLDMYAAYYRFSPVISNPRLGGILGWFYAEAEAKGALTASNQHFAYFPYNYYSLDGSFGLHVGFGAVDLTQAFSFFQYHIILGAAHIFHSDGGADIHYKEKTLFGGEENFDTKSLDAGGIGAAFVLLDAGFPALRLGRQKKARLALGLKKLFVIPWGYKKASSGASASPEASNPFTGELLKTVLLSGLSFYGSLSW